MSWPSFYGYKYTPIGLRQREVKDESGTKSVNTTVHLPEGGHLLDIERKFNPDGSVSKREAALLPDHPSSPYYPLRAPSPGPIASPATFPHEPRSFADLDRQAEDIIANFRARQASGLDQRSSSVLASSCQKSCSRVSQSTEVRKECRSKTTMQAKRAAKAFLDEDF